MMEPENETVPIAQAGPSKPARVRSGLINEGFSSLPNIADIPIENFFHDCSLSGEIKDGNSTSTSTQEENEQLEKVDAEEVDKTPEATGENGIVGSLSLRISSFLAGALRNLNCCGRTRENPNVSRPYSMRDIVEVEKAPYKWTVQEFVEVEGPEEEIKINERNFSTFKDADCYVESYKARVATVGGTVPHFRVFRANHEDDEEERKDEDETALQSEHYFMTRSSGMPPSVIDTTDPNLDEEWVIGIEESD